MTTRAEAKEEKGRKKIRNERWSFVVLASISVLLSLACILFCVRLVNENNHQWCDIVDTIVVTPVPKPVDAKEHPSRVRAYEYYLKFFKLQRSLGCVK